MAAKPQGDMPRGKQFGYLFLDNVEKQSLPWFDSDEDVLVKKIEEILYKTKQI